MYTPNLLISTVAFRAVALCVLCAALGACGGPVGGTSDRTGNLVMNFSGFNEHIGDTLYLKVSDTESLNSPSVITPRTITNGSFTVMVPDAILADSDYEIDFWIDVDSSGTLDRSPYGNPEGVDESWRLERMGQSGGLTVNFAHDEDWTDITPF